MDKRNIDLIKEKKGSSDIGSLPKGDSHTFSRFLETLNEFSFLTKSESKKQQEIWHYPNYNPFTADQIEEIKRSFRFSVDINKEFERTIKRNEELILRTLNTKTYNEIPQKIRNLLSQYRKYLYKAYLLLPEKDSKGYKKTMDQIKKIRESLESILESKAEKSKIDIAHITLHSGFYDLNHIDLMVKDKDDSNIYEKTKKLLYTLLYEYNIKPREIERSLSRRTLPPNVEYQIIQHTSESGKISDSIKNIRECGKIKKNYKYKTLKEKGWIYKDLPEELKDYYGTKKLIKKSSIEIPSELEGHIKGIPPQIRPFPKLIEEFFDLAKESIKLSEKPAKTIQQALWKKQQLRNLNHKMDKILERGIYFPTFLRTLRENSFLLEEQSKFQESWKGFALEDLKGMKRIGNKTIDRLKENYNSIEEIYYESKNSPSALAEKIYGISKEKAKKIWKFIEDKISTKNSISSLDDLISVLGKSGIHINPEITKELEEDVLRIEINGVSCDAFVMDERVAVFPILMEYYKKLEEIGWDEWKYNKLFLEDVEKILNGLPRGREYYIGTFGEFDAYLFTKERLENLKKILPFLISYAKAFDLSPYDYVMDVFKEHFGKESENHFTIQEVANAKGILIEMEKDEPYAILLSKGESVKERYREYSDMDEYSDEDFKMFYYDFNENGTKCISHKGDQIKIREITK
jgi:hypothetical protein